LKKFQSAYQSAMNKAENFTANIFDPDKAQYVTQYDGVIFQLQVQGL
jgi:hypothetical protein